MTECDFTIVIDTREKIPWEFAGKPSIINTVKYGDYTIQGMESVFAIERKRSTGEFAGNMTEQRFPVLLNKLSQIPHKFIICEFDFEKIMSYPLGSGIPKSKYRRIRVSPNWMIKYFTDILIVYNIPVIFAGNSACAETIAYSLMKEAVLKCR